MSVLIDIEEKESQCIFFFFQAEDGIRDLTVTGVQTCALPISPGAISRCRRARARNTDGRRLRAEPVRGPDRPRARLRSVRYRRSPEGYLAPQAQARLNASGRASWRKGRPQARAAGAALCEAFSSASTSTAPRPAWRGSCRGP